MSAAVVVLAALLAIAPIPGPLVERWYSGAIFPELQRVLTPASNVVPFALFDLLLVAATVALALFVYRSLRDAGWRRGALRIARVLALSTSIVYLVFLATWGLNYRRVRLIDKVEFDAARVNAAAARSLGEANATTLNRLYADAHRAPLSIEKLAAAFHATQRQLGASRPIVPGRPKQTLLGGYFHQIAVTGMTDPFFLETLVAPDLLEVERPFVIAHEWAHLAGYADESEANYVAWLACRHGDDQARYSAALSLIGYAAPSEGLHTALEMGPRLDLFAIQRRYVGTSRVLRSAARESYDKYLKANRVEKGVESYDAVVQLILGTTVDEAGYPRRR